MTDTPSVPPPSGGTYTPPPPPPPSGPGATPPGGPSSDRTLMIALSYLWFLGIIPLLIKKDDREVKWHAINGLGLFLAYLIVTVVWNVLVSVVFNASGCGLGSVLWAASCAIQIGYIAAIIMAIMKGVKGEKMRFPLISDFADKA